MCLVSVGTHCVIAAVRSVIPPPVAVGGAEYGERPLKLVLKVSGNEVTAGSSTLDTFYNEQPADHDKPKDKKKKKKKDKEKSFGSPEDDRGKKKVTSLKTLSPGRDRTQDAWTVCTWIVFICVCFCNVRWPRRRKDTMEMEMMKENNAELLFVQSWTNRKVKTDLISHLRFFACLYRCLLFIVTPELLLTFRERTDSSAGSVEPAHQAAPEVQCGSFIDVTTLLGINVLAHTPVSLS